MGSGFGYSAYWMAKALREPDASIICTDGSQENAEQAAAYLARGGIAERIDYRVGNALEIIDETDFLLFAMRSDRFVGAVTCICVTRHRRCRCLLSIKNVEKDIVFFGLRRRTFNHQPTYPFALRQDKKPRLVSKN